MLIFVSKLLIFGGIVMTIVGYYKVREASITKPKVVYKFIEHDISEAQRAFQDSVYNRFSTMFTDMSLGAS